MYLEYIDIKSNKLSISISGGEKKELNRRLEQLNVFAFRKRPTEFLQIIVNQKSLYQRHV